MHVLERERKRRKRKRERVRDDLMVGVKRASVKGHKALLDIR